MFTVYCENCKKQCSVIRSSYGVTIQERVESFDEEDPNSLELVDTIDVEDQCFSDYAITDFNCGVCREILTRNGEEVHTVYDLADLMSFQKGEDNA